MNTQDKFYVIEFEDGQGVDSQDYTGRTQEALDDALAYIDELMYDLEEADIKFAYSQEVHNNGEFYLELRTQDGVNYCLDGIFVKQIKD
jgi:succinate dehydrogenase/fumarate reductase flavoprotein subunit